MITKTDIIVRYAETDKMGITHHKNYFTWYEEARSNHGRQTGLPYSQIEASGIMSPLVECSSRFIIPTTYEDELTVECEIVSLTPVKLEYEYKIYNKKTEKLVNTGRSLHTFVDSKTFKVLRLNKADPELYAKLEALVRKEA